MRHAEDVTRTQREFYCGLHCRGLIRQLQPCVSRKVVAAGQQHKGLRGQLDDRSRLRPEHLSQILNGPRRECVMISSSRLLRPHVG